MTPTTVYRLLHGTKPACSRSYNTHTTKTSQVGCDVDLPQNHMSSREATFMRRPWACFFCSGEKWLSDSDCAALLNSTCQEMPTAIRDPLLQGRSPRLQCRFTSCGWM